MNGRPYLARLVERVAPSEPLLRRRQPALFENAHADSAAALQPSAPEALPDVHPPARQADVPIAAMPRPTQAVAATTPSAARSAAIEVRLPSEQPRADHTLRAPAVDVPPPRAHTIERAALAAPHAAPVAARPAAVVERIVDRQREPATPMPPRTEERAQAVLPQRNERPATPPALQLHTVVQRMPAPAVAEPAAARAARAAAVPSTAVVRRAAALATPAAQPAPRASAPPPIDITIGRIEVRAVAAPSQPRRGVAAPKLGLDQYLSEREGRR